MSEALNTLELTVGIVSAHVEHNRVRAEDVAALIRTVHEALSALGAEPAEDKEPARPTGAVSARKSLADPGRIVSMIDGKAYSTLTRHIKRHGYTPDSYREAFGLRSDYPMVAPAFAERRREIANQIGLGRKKGEKQLAKAKRG